MTVEGQIKVLDFGIARLVEPMGDGPLTHTGFAIGTPSFMPPEQARGRWDLVDARTDVWAVGATMYALLTGDRPRHGATTTQEELLLAMTQPLPPLASVLPDIAPEVAAIVDRAVAYDREARWPDAMAMRQALSTLLGNPGVVDSKTQLPASMIALAGAGRTDGATVAVPDGALTTGRPFSSQSLPLAPAPSKAAWVVVFGLAALATLIVAGAVVLVVSRTAHHPPASAPAIATSIPIPTPTPTPTATPTPTPTATATPQTSAAPVPTTSSSPSAHPSSKPAPLAPRGPAANPFDQRF